jgi:hypothetical protein
MKDGFLQELVDTKHRKHNREWNEAFIQYVQERGIDPMEYVGATEEEMKGGVGLSTVSVGIISVLRMFCPKTGFTMDGMLMDGSINHQRYAPDDLVAQIKSSADLQDVLCKIVSETYDNIDSNMEENLGSVESISQSPPEGFAELYEYLESRSDLEGAVPSSIKEGIESYICLQMVDYFKGMVDYEGVSSKASGQENYIPENCPDRPVRVAISAMNSRGFEDVDIYEVDSAEDFFGSSWGEETRMFGDLLKSDKEPNHMIRDVAFSTAGPSWHKSPPPENPVTEGEADWKNRRTYRRIKNPKETFGSDWGNIDRMSEKMFGESGESEVVCSTRGINQFILAGIRY